MMEPSSVVTNEDCMALMARYPDKHFDLAVVDTPFGLNKGTSVIDTITKKDGKTKKGFSHYGRKVHVKKSWDEHPPGVEFFQELFRVSVFSIIWGANWFLDKLPNTRCFLFWDKVVVNATITNEIAWTNLEEKPAVFSRVSGLDKGFLAGPFGHIHPTQKPIALYDWIYKNYAKPGWKILDTHLGSGSNRIAAFKAGLDFVACELDKDYFDAQEKRWKNFRDQLSFDSLDQV